jgi:hypothetical protein
MSDNIDYDELDKAVKAAATARDAAKAAPKPKAEAEAPKVAPRKTPAPAKRPLTRGVAIDFAPQRILHNAPRPAAKTIPVRPVAKPAPINRLMSRPAPKQVAKTIAKPTVAPARPVSKPQLRPATPRQVAKPVAKPAAVPRPATPKPVAKPVAPKPVAHRPATPLPAAKPAAPKAPAPRPATPKPAPKPATHAAPNANNYSLGGRSPFVANTKVEKRPLGLNVPDTSASSIRSTHNTYSQKSPTRATENAKKHIVTQEPKKKSGWLWALAVLGIIVAGGAVGMLAYLLVFAH